MEDVPDVVEPWREGRLRVEEEVELFVVIEGGLKCCVVSLCVFEGQLFVGLLIEFM